MAALALLSSDDHDLSIKTTETQEALAEKLDALSIVTAYSHAMTNVVVNPVSSPPEPWYTTLNENLGLGKSHAQTWLTDIAPKVGAVIPQSIINYTNTFMATSDEILRILSKGPLSQQDKNDIIELIQATLDALGEEKSQVDAVQKKIVTLAGDFQADHTRLVTGQNGAAEAVRLAEDDRVRMETKIAQLQTELDAARAKVTASGIGLGLAIFVAVAAFALAVATGGAGLIVAGAVGVVGVGVAATFTGIYTAEISSLIQEIFEEQQRLENKKRQVVALRGLIGTVDSLKNHNESAKQALTTVQTMWSTLGDKLEAVIKDLKGNKVDASTALQRANIRTARQAWEQTAAFAQSVQSLAAGTTQQPAIQHETLMRAFG